MGKRAFWAVRLLVVVATTLAGGVVAAGSTETGATADASPVGEAAASAPLATSAVPLAMLRAERLLQVRLAIAMSPAALSAAGAKKSCAEVEQGGQVIFADHPGLPVVPASNMKLLTATAALGYLGAGYRFETSVLASSLPVAGVVRGNLYLRGGGDPLLRLPSYAEQQAPGGGVYTNFTRLVGLLEKAGVHEVTGSVVGDASRYDSLQAVPSWPARFEQQGDAGPLSALDLDDGFAQAGEPVPPTAPPAEQTAGTLTYLLRSAGVDVRGHPVVGKTPDGARTLATLVSPPLGEELGEILRESDNTAMELLTKELGLAQFGNGSTEAGVRAVRADLAADGLPTAGLVDLDGSGLSYQDRATCQLLLSVLEGAGPDGLLVRDLALSARSGTLQDQLVGTVAAGRVRAKTGTLNGVKALSGWVYPPLAPVLGARLSMTTVPLAPRAAPAKTEPVAFAVVLNGLPLSLPDPASLTDRVALDIARYLETVARLAQGGAARPPVGPARTARPPAGPAEREGRRLGEHERVWPRGS